MSNTIGPRAHTLLAGLRLGLVRSDVHPEQGMAALILAQALVELSESSEIPELLEQDVEAVLSRWLEFRGLVNE